jgi:hypothetical protein
LKLGGYIEFWGGYGANDKTRGVVNDFDIKQDTEIHFSIKKKLDSGIKVGAKLEMESGVGNTNAKTWQASTIFDESYGWMQTKFGKFSIGNNDVASAYVGGVSVVGPMGITKSDVADWLPDSQGLLNNTDVDLGAGDAQNITYFTPKVNGLQAIFSYVPDKSDGGANTAYDDQETTGFHNHFSGALKYGAKMGGTSVSLGAGYSTVENTDTVGAASESNGYGMTARISFSGLKLSATHAHENNASDTDQYWAVAALYKAGKNSFSIGYADAQEDGNTGGTKNTSNLVTVGHQMSIGKGVTWASSIASAENNQSGSTKVDGVAVVSGFKMKF